MKDIHLNNLYFQTMHIIQDIWNISTIIKRLSWMREKACQDDYLRQMWMFFAGVDIEIFHIELRAIMNYVAELISEYTNKKGVVPTSFRKLYQWLPRNSENQKILGEDFTNLIVSAKWFPDILNIRDMLIHQGAFTLVFGKPEDGILFQIYRDGYRELISKDFYILKENIASFERYAALYISQLLLFLEQFAKIFRNKLSFTSDIKDSRISAAGFDVLIQWIDISIEHIN